MTAERGAQILVVDDNPQNIALVQAQLERAGYGVLPVNNGQAALDAALATPPDLILLDVMMPGLDGYEVCRRLRQHDATRAIPVIMLTSLQEQSDRLRALDAGADDFLSKPFDRAELLARVRSSLRMKRIFDDLMASNREIEAQTQEIAAEKSRVDAILSSMSDGVLMTDAEGRITFLNDAVVAMTGTTLAECRARPWYEALGVRTSTGQPIDPSSCPIMEAIRGRTPVDERELSIWGSDGREVIIRLVASPVHSGSGQASGGVAVFRDVTSQREIQRLKEDFVGLVSHELRTPLAAIYGFAELILERERLSEATRTYLETMYKEAERMTNLINDFLDIERLASGRMSFHFRSVHLGDVIAEMREDMASQLSRHPVIVDLPKDPIYVRADGDRLVQVFLNLLSNAIKYSPDGGDIHICAEARGREICISVKDEGLGLPPAAIPKLFEKFYRVETTEHQHVSGTGLGLAICRQIVEEMGGRIWAESAGVRHGSTFSFTLPVAGAPVIRVPQPPLGLAHNRILIAKDDPGLAGLILEQLGAVGYAVEAVSSGEEAISHVRADKPAAVVLDVGLAGRVDGWSVLAALREDAATAEVPVVLVAGRANQEHTLALGVDEFLVKPVSSQRLVGAIKRLAGAPTDRPVIVADDDETNRKLVQEILMLAGFTVIPAVDGEEALRAMHDSDPQALVLDLIMPKLDGFGVLEALRTDERLSDLPVLVLTAKDLPADQRDLLRRRTTEVLHRPGASGKDIATALLSSMKPARIPQQPATCAAQQSVRQPVVGVA